MYYIVEKSGYRRGVHGRSVQVHKEFKTFCHTTNNKKIIREQKSGLVLGCGDSLEEAKKSMLKLLAGSGIEPTKHRIRKMIDEYGPRPLTNKK